MDSQAEPLVGFDTVFSQFAMPLQFWCGQRIGQGIAVNRDAIGKLAICYSEIVLLSVAGCQGRDLVDGLAKVLHALAAKFEKLQAKSDRGRTGTRFNLLNDAGWLDKKERGASIAGGDAMN
jgi:hypothetical protein